MCYELKTRSHDSSCPSPSDFFEAMHFLHWEKWLLVNSVQANLTKHLWENCVTTESFQQISMKSHLFSFLFIFTGLRRNATVPRDCCS